MWFGLDSLGVDCTREVGRIRRVATLMMLVMCNMKLRATCLAAIVDLIGCMVRGAQAFVGMHASELMHTFCGDVSHILHA